MATYTKLTSGKWRVQIRKQGFYRNRTFQRKMDAKTWATQIEAQINSTSATGLIQSKALLSELINHYQDSTKPRGRTARACYARLSDRLGNIKLSALTQLHVQDFADTRLKECQAQTVASDLSYLSKVLSWARTVKKIDVDPAIARNVRAGLTMSGHSTRSNERDRMPTIEEIDLMKGWWSAHKSQIPMSVIVDFAMANGMRLGEICRIKTADVDVNKKTVIIRERKDPKKKEQNDQIVPLLGEAWDIVKNRMKEYPDRLFPYKAASVSNNFTKTCQYVDIDDLRFHDLRHYAITNLFRKGLSIPLVSIVSGHKHWNNLKRYTELSADDVHKAFGGDL